MDDILNKKVSPPSKGGEMYQAYIQRFIPNLCTKLSRYFAYPTLRLTAMGMGVSISGPVCKELLGCVYRVAPEGLIPDLLDGFFVALT